MSAGQQQKQSESNVWTHAQYPPSFTSWFWQVSGRTATLHYVALCNRVGVRVSAQGLLKKPCSRPMHLMALLYYFAPQLSDALCMLLLSRCCRGRSCRPQPRPHNQLHTSSGTAHTTCNSGVPPLQQEADTGCCSA
eukprot:109458-Chlamydomonas_euryale.AAC.4